MRRTVLGLCVVAGLGLTGYLLAGDVTGDHAGCQSAATVAKEGGGGCGGCPVAAALAENANFKHANELLKSWQEAPAKLAAMTENEKTELQAGFKKLAESHPAVQAFEPTMVFLHSGLATMTQIDAAAKQLCEEAAAPTTRPAAEHAAAGTNGATVALASAEGQVCPKAAAAMASAKMKMRESVMLTAKANELMMTACAAAHPGECSDGAKSGATVALASGEGHAAKAGGCCGGAKSEAALTSATDKSASKAEGGCCGGGAKTTAALASGTDKSAAKAEGSCCSGAKASTAAMASSEGKPCVKSLVARSQEIVNQSGPILAQWQGAGIQLAAMDSAQRESVVKLCSSVMASCPIGSRMPDTMETVAGLLRDAATLNAQAMAECCHNPNLAKMIPAGAKELAEARMQVLSAMINVLEKSNGSMKPARQVASAQ